MCSLNKKKSLFERSTDISLELFSQCQAGGIFIRLKPGAYDSPGKLFVIECHSGKMQL